MIQDVRQHSTHYAFLAGFLTVMMALFLRFKDNEAAAAGVLLLTGTGYIAWGLVHHYLKRDLSAKIAVEYILMAMLVITILTAVLLSR